MKTITIKGNDNDILNVELLDILKLIPNGENYQWKILWINGVSKDCNKFDILSFEKKVKINGLKISFKELEKLSLKLQQLIEFVLIGKKNDIDKIDISNEDTFLKNKCDFFIELIDSSYWEITTNKFLLKDI